MPGRQSVEDLVAEATKIADVWKANTSFSLGSVTLDSFKATMSAVQTANVTVEGKRTGLSGLITERDSKARELSELVSRALSGVRATFGRDSMQYPAVPTATPTTINPDGTSLRSIPRFHPRPGSPPGLALFRG